MGTEIISIIAIITPFLIYRIIKRLSTKKAKLELLIAIIFLSSFIIIASFKGHFLQGLIIGSAFYVPFYLITSMLFKKLLGKRKMS